MRKKIMIGFFGIFLCVMILQISPLRGASFTLTDETADVKHYVGSVMDDPGPNVHSEIDIASLEIEGETLKLTFVDNPIDAENYTYSFRIYWIGDDTLGNWTKGAIGDSRNEVHTKIEHSTNGVIVDDYIYDEIVPNGLNLMIPLFNTTMISQLLDPSYVWIYTEYEIDWEESYQDILIYDDNPFPFPGFTFWITMGGVSLIVMIGLILNKKKN